MAVLWKGRGVALWGKRDGKGAIAALERALAQAVTGLARYAPQRALDLAEEARRIFGTSGEAGQRVTESITAWLRLRGRP